MRRRRAEATGSAARRLRLLPLALALALACAGLQAAAAQLNPGDPAARVIALEPRLSLTETLTDNHLPGDALGKADAVTRLTAGLGWRGRSGLVRGYADYALTGVVYARHSDRNELQNALNARVTADLLEDRLQLVGAAVMARSAISAFGPQPGFSGSDSTNVTETRTLQLTPTLRGPLGRSVRYTATVAHTLTSTANAGIGDSVATNALLHLEPSERARLGWTLDASRLASDFKLGRKTHSDRLYGGLSYDVDLLDLRLSATGGTESTNISSVDTRRYSTWGMGLRWTPSPRTLIQADMEERFFGRSHQIVLEYRLPRTVFGLRSARSLSTTGNQLVGQRTIDLQTFINSLDRTQFQTDADREAEAIRRMTDLKLDPTRSYSDSFLRSAATLQDRLELSVLWTGLRQTVLLTAARGTTRRVDAISTAFDDLSLVDRVRSSTLALNLSHRLTPLSTLTLQVSALQNSSDRAGLSSRQQQALLLWQTSLTPKSTATATLRRVHYNTSGRPSDETALLASYGVRF